MNLAMVIGNVGSAELSAPEGKSPVLRFSLATNERFSDKEGNRQERTTWHRCVVFGNRATSLAPHVVKGSKLAVTGRIENSEYEKEGVKHYSSNIIVDQLEFVGTKVAGASEETGTNGTRAPVDTAEVPF